MGPATAVRLLETLGGALEAVKAGADPRTQLELALVKTSRPEVDGSLRALLGRIERLEGRPAAPVVAQPTAVDQPTTVDQPTAVPTARPIAAATTRADDSPVPSPTATPPPSDDPPAAPIEADDRQPAPIEIDDPSAVPVPADDPSAAPVEIDEPSATPVPADLDSLWPAVVELVGAENKLLSAVLADARPMAVQDGELTVAFAATASFLKKKAEGSDHRAAVGQALREVTDRRIVRVAYELRDELPPAAGHEPERGPRTEDEWVARFIEEFDAEEVR